MKAESTATQACIEDLSVYLSEIYALERHTESIWSARMDKIPSEHENIRNCLEEHVCLKKTHITELKKCLREISADAPDVESSPHYISDIGLQLAADDLQAEAFCNTVFERFEAAIYRKIIDSAERAGYDNIAVACRAILKQEEIVAHWLEHAMREVPLTNGNAEDAPEAEQGEGFFIDARLMQLRHPEIVPKK